MQDKPSVDWSELFIGRDENLRDLHQLWKDVQPHFCVLRGESGFGKTKIVQKFYSELSTSPIDDPNRYWPDNLLKEQNNLRVNPKFSESSLDKEIPWLWWGLRWTNPDDYNRGKTSSCVLLANNTFAKIMRKQEGQKE